jgi:hypothetical protein
MSQPIRVWKFPALLRGDCAIAPQLSLDCPWTRECDMRRAVQEPTGNLPFDPPIPKECRVLLPTIHIPRDWYAARAPVMLSVPLVPPPNLWFEGVNVTAATFCTTWFENRCHSCQTPFVNRGNVGNSQHFLAFGVLWAPGLRFVASEKDFGSLWKRLAP